MKAIAIKLAPLAVAITLIGCNSKKVENTKQEAEKPLVTVVTATEKEYTPILSYTGTVFANKEANLGATLPGKVEKIFFEEGQKVQKGQLIAELSDEMLTQADIEYETIKKDYERVSRLRDKGSISEMEYDHVKAKYEASEAKMELVKKNTQVYAPFSGIIAERMIEEGEVYFINPGLEPGYSVRSGIVRLMQVDPVKVKFDVNEVDLNKIRKGLEVAIRFDGIKDKTFSAKIDNIKPMLSTLTRSTSVEVTLSNPNLEFKPGMFAYIDVKLPKVKAVFVPLKSISRLDGTSEEYLFTLDNNTVKRVTVKQITTIGDETVVSGVESGAQIIAEGKSKVKNGSEVRVAK
ncbi:MAG TPA: efflux RND transporter periplasmic adaptor subunit [Tenuifilaceae bacterium]|nr:efflux RND transporter periplasmic adaptor subunit [Tenuifilaceae bacterium]